jgi:hypothetical protein
MEHRKPAGNRLFYCRRPLGIVRFELGRINDRGWYIIRPMAFFPDCRSRQIRARRQTVPLSSRWRIASVGQYPCAAASWHKKVEHNPNHQNRQRDQWGKIMTIALDLALKTATPFPAIGKRAAGLYDEDPPIWYQYRHRVMNQRPCNHQERGIRAWKIA